LKIQQKHIIHNFQKSFYKFALFLIIFQTLQKLFHITTLLSLVFPTTSFLFPGFQIATITTATAKNFLCDPMSQMVAVLETLLTDDAGVIQLAVQTLESGHPLSDDPRTDGLAIAR
jgi:hypothetical protein